MRTVTTTRNGEYHVITGKIGTSSSTSIFFYQNIVIRSIYLYGETAGSAPDEYVNASLYYGATVGNVTELKGRIAKRPRVSEQSTIKDIYMVVADDVKRNYLYIENHSSSNELKYIIVYEVL